MEEEKDIEKYFKEKEYILDQMDENLRIRLKQSENLMKTYSPFEFLSDYFKKFKIILKSIRIWPHKFRRNKMMHS